MQAYILVALESATEQQVFKKLEKLKEIKEMHILFGEWDIIIEVDVQSSEHLGDFVMQHIRSLSEVKLTSTMIVAK